MARASASVVGSGTVGPEPITAGSSPGTSEIASVTSRAGCARAAKRPPLMRERCLRTVLISPMLAPQREQRARHGLLLGKREARRRRDPVGRGAAGQQHQHEIVGAGRFGELQRALGAGEPGCIRHRMAGLDHRRCAGSAGRSRGA